MTHAQQSRSHHGTGSVDGQASQTASHRQAGQPPAAGVPPAPMFNVISSEVLEAVAHRHRHYLGDFIYEPGLRAERLAPSMATHRGFSSNPKPLPWQVIKGKENCVLTVKIAQVHLTQIARAEITARSYLWGTEVYTDDSDVVAACIHSGWIRGAWPEKVDMALLIGSSSNQGDGKATEEWQTKTGRKSEGLLLSPPASGPVEIMPDRDLHVNVLILPRLIKYTGSTRYGISSREFGGRHGTRRSVHDGISYMIKSIRWVENGARPQARLRGRGRRERMRRVMGEVTSFSNLHGLEPAQGKELKQGGLPRGEIRGNWQLKSTQNAAKDKETSTKGDEAPKSSEVDKENRKVEEEGSENKAAEAALAAAVTTTTATATTDTEDKEMVDANGGQREAGEGGSG